MSPQLNLATILSSPQRSVHVRRASESDTRLPPSALDSNTSSSNPRSTRPPPTNDSPARPTPSTPFAPFDDNAIEAIDTPRWQRILDDHFARVFRRSVLLSDRPPIDDMVARALQIVGIPTRAKARGLATAVYAHWVRIQSRSKDANVAAPQIVAFVSGTAARLGRTDVQAQKHFMEHLDRLCIERLKLTWRWYTAVSLRKALPISHQESFTQVMSVIAMVSHLYRAGLFQHGAALKGMKHIATMVPWPDAVAIIYAFMHKLGPEFALEPAGWQFVQHLLAEILPLTANRMPLDTICQLVLAINTLLVEWHNKTSVTLYHT